jgi:hypothetical protein
MCQAQYGLQSGTSSRTSSDVGSTATADTPAAIETSGSTGIVAGAAAATHTIIVAPTQGVLRYGECSPFPVISIITQRMVI